MSERVFLGLRGWVALSATLAGCAASTGAGEGGATDASDVPVLLDARPDGGGEDARREDVPVALDVALDVASDGGVMDASDTADASDASSPDVVRPPDVLTSETGVVLTCAEGADGPPVCAGACGNGMIDRCMECVPCGGGGGPGGSPVPPRDGGTCCTTVSEECDGTVTTTCAALGYRGGVVRCGGGCRYDTSGCERCSAGANVARCAAPAARQSVGANFGLDAAGDTAALAWISEGAGAGSTLQLALYDAELARRGLSPCVSAPGGHNASVAATSRGWLVAYDTADESGGAQRVFVQRFDREARPEGAPVVFSGGSSPRLTRGDGSLVLLEYVGASGRFGASVLAGLFGSDGALSVAPSGVFDGTYGLDHESAVWVGDAFLLSARSFDGTVDATQLVRFERDGRVSARGRPLGTETEYAQLTWDGARAGVLYGTFRGEARMLWQWLDPRGGATGDPLGVPSLPSFGAAYAATLGAGSYYLVRSSTPDLLGGRIDGSLRPVAALAPLGRGGDFSSNDRVRVVPMGARVVVAWTTSLDVGNRALSAALVNP